MKGSVLRTIIRKLPKLLKEGVKKIPWAKAASVVKKPSTWLAVAGGVSVGALIRQPEVNKLSKEVRKAHSREERLQTTIRNYHEQFMTVKAKMSVLQAKENSEEAKKNAEDGRSLVLYQYAAKEFTELCLRMRDEQGSGNLSEEERKFYRVFQKVLNGEKLVREDAKYLQHYIFPKYKRQIDNLIEFDYDGLLAQISMI